MQYNFNEVIERRGTGSLKWDVGENELAMWVADMDFRTAPCVIEEIKKAADFGIFGYKITSDAWAKAYADRWESAHGYRLREDRLCFATGVVPIVSSAVRKLTTPAEKVIIQTPSYNIFFNSVINNGRRVLENPLKYDGEGYEMDFDDLEEKLKDPEATLLILCNPQNPTGNLWDKKTLVRLAEMCRANGVNVISDEIHCDIVPPGKGYTPFASVCEASREISVTAISPTKAFNLAGLQTAAFYAENEVLFNKMRRAVNTDEVAEPNVFAESAAIAAFNKGGEWLCELNAYIAENKRRAAEFIAEKLPFVKVCRSEATYLLWLDVSSVCSDSGLLADFLRQNTGLYVSRGEQYGANGKSFLRMNTACPVSRLEDGLCRLYRGIAEYIDKNNSEAN